MANDKVFSLAEYCDDCDSWHVAHYWIHNDGTYTVADSDGNHDDIGEKDLPTDGEHDTSWYEYAKWVKKTGNDVLGEYCVAVTQPESFLAYLVNCPKGIRVTEIKRVDPLPGKRYTPAKAPKAVRQYLGLTYNKRTKYWLLDDMGCANCLRSRDQHAQGKCLFESTRFKPMCVERLPLVTEVRKNNTIPCNLSSPRPKRDIRADILERVNQHIKRYEAEHDQKARPTVDKKGVRKSRRK